MAGFTLVEMLAVLAVLGLGAVILVGRIDEQPGGIARVRAVAELEARIADARREAVLTGTPVRLDPAAAVAGAEVAQAPFGDALTFFPDGSATGGTISVRGEPVLSVDWLTGEAERAR